MFSEQWDDLRYLGGGLDECEIFTNGIKVYRAIPRNPSPRWKNTHSIIESDKYIDLCERGYIQLLKKTDIDSANFPTIFKDQIERIIYETDFVPFALWPLEPHYFWTISHYKEFLRTVCIINIEFSKYKCEEPFAGHFAFVGSRPRLMDIGSISNRNIHDMIRASMLRLLNGTGIKEHIQQVKMSPNYWSELLNIIDDIPLEVTSNVWDDYNKTPLPSPGSITNNSESIWLRKQIDKYSIKTVLDLAGNSGYFAFEIERPDLRICSIDNSINAITKGFEHAKKYDSKVVFYNVDLLKKYKPYVGRINGREMRWQSFLEADCVVASSITHHLYHQGCNVNDQIRLFDDLTKRVLLVEFIDKQDPHVRNWPQQWSKEEFLNKMKINWKMTDSFGNYSNDDSCKPYRTWYAFEKLEPKQFSLGLKDYMYRPDLDD